MSCAIWVIPNRFQSQSVPREQAQRGARQLDLPIQGLRLFRVLLGGLRHRLRRRQPVDRLIYFGKHKQFVKVGADIRRVSQ